MFLFSFCNHYNCVCIVSITSVVSTESCHKFNLFINNVSITFLSCNLDLDVLHSCRSRKDHHDHEKSKEDEHSDDDKDDRDRYHGDLNDTKIDKKKAKKK